MIIIIGLDFCFIRAKSNGLNDIGAVGDLFIWHVAYGLVWVENMAIKFYRAQKNMGLALLILLTINRVWLFLFLQYGIKE
jgi:hypothetical protein